MSKIKKIEVEEGGGRDALLSALGQSLTHERITAGEYVVVITKIPPEWQITVRPRATRIRGGGRKRGAYRY